jgi:hypothetical protein
MFLGVQVFGNCVFNNTIPPKSQQNKITFYGDCVLDGIHLQNTEISDSEILALNSEELFFNINTILLANFEHTLECGNLYDSVYPVQSLRIRRIGENESLNKIIAEVPYDSLDVNNMKYIDYTPQNRKNYTYTISPMVLKDGTVYEARGCEGVGLVDFYGWTLSSIEATPTQYKFDLEIESDNIEVVTDFKKYDTYGIYPIFRWGNRNYRESALKTIPYSYTALTDTFDIDTTVLNNIKSFINDKNTKVLRNAAGEQFNVVTHDFSYKYFDTIQDQPFKISFRFTEVADV